MHPQIASLARRYELPPDCVTELEALVTRPAPPHTRPADGPPLLMDRYEDLGLLGRGGMGSVRRVRDVVLNRVMAMKVVHRQLLAAPSGLARFLEEAQTTAQLQHPNIVPVHDLGELPDGRVWFTMAEVRGRTLHEVIGEVHDVSLERWEVGEHGWTFRRLMVAFLAVCNAVAYAHERGVLHRDLKPDNIMVGAHDEVYVLDWGLAKILCRPEPAAQQGAVDAVSTDRSASGAFQTRVGKVAGTPAYMPPEQARGQVDRIDARSDVYALGAILYQILSGCRPYAGSAAEVVAKVLAGPPSSLRGLPPGNIGFGFLDQLDAAPSGPQVPDELVSACERAMARKPDARYTTATALAAVIRDWLDGSRRRQQALDVVARADGLIEQAEALEARGVALQAEGDRALEGIEPWRPESEKQPGWAKQDEASAVLRAAELKRLEVDQTLHGALQIDPHLPEAHAALATRYQTRHAAAEEARDLDQAAKASALLATHANALPVAHRGRMEAASYLRGDGSLTLVSDPPGAQVLLYRAELGGRRLVEHFERSLGATPLTRVPLAMGSYVCVLRHPDRPEVRYPVHISRRAEWHGVRPGGTAPHPIWLPPAALWPTGADYVPAGWFRSGGDPAAFQALRARRLWCDGLFMQRFPVTNRQYLAFLNDLVGHDREAEALACVPRERASTEGELGAVIFGRDRDGRFVLGADADGDTWHPDVPVCMVDWHGARAFLMWLAARSGTPWRLPSELEWEKASRGVDGRFYPWGDSMDPSWCHMGDSHQTRRAPARVESYPIDCSPYGVRGLGGNTRDWCSDPWLDAGAPYVDDLILPHSSAPAGEELLRAVRGGGWISQAKGVRSAYRGGSRPSFRSSSLGLRGACQVDAMNPDSRP